MNVEALSNRTPLFQEYLFSSSPLVPSPHVPSFVPKSTRYAESSRGARAPRERSLGVMNTRWSLTSQYNRLGEISNMITGVSCPEHSCDNDRTLSQILTMTIVCNHREQVTLSFEWKIDSRVKSRGFLQQQPRARFQADRSPADNYVTRSTQSNCPSYRTVQLTWHTEVVSSEAPGTTSASSRTKLGVRPYRTSSEERESMLRKEYATQTYALIVIINRERVLRIKRNGGRKYFQWQRGRGTLSFHVLPIRSHSPSTSTMIASSITRFLRPRLLPIRELKTPDCLRTVTSFSRDSSRQISHGFFLHLPSSAFKAPFLLTELKL